MWAGGLGCCISTYTVLTQRLRSSSESRRLSRSYFRQRSQRVSFSWSYQLIFFHGLRNYISSFSIPGPLNCDPNCPPSVRRSWNKWRCFAINIFFHSFVKWILWWVWRKQTLICRRRPRFSEKGILSRRVNNFQGRKLFLLLFGFQYHFSKCFETVFTRRDFGTPQKNSEGRWTRSIKSVYFQYESCVCTVKEVNIHRARNTQNEYWIWLGLWADFFLWTSCEYSCIYPICSNLNTTLWGHVNMCFKTRFLSLVGDK